MSSSRGGWSVQLRQLASFADIAQSEEQCFPNIDMGSNPVVGSDIFLPYCKSPFHCGLLFCDSLPLSFRGSYLLICIPTLLPVFAGANHYSEVLMIVGSTPTAGFPHTFAPDYVLDANSFIRVGVTPTRRSSLCGRCVVFFIFLFFRGRENGLVYASVAPVRVFLTRRVVGSTPTIGLFTDIA